MKHQAHKIKKAYSSALAQARYAKSNNIITASFFALAVVFVGIGIFQFNRPATNAANLCNTNDIVSSGIHSQADIARHHKANTCGDFRGIYNHYRISANLAAGDKVLHGTANNKGEVVAGGRVVATNAESIGRHAIKNSRPIRVAGKTYYQTSHVGGRAFANPNASLPTLVILDKDGNFKNAIVKACGNPIYARPNNPPKPPEPPKPVVNNISVCELATKKLITIKETEFDTSKHSKNFADCKIVVISVCDLTTDKIIKINEEQFDAKKHSKDLKDCSKIRVCDLKTMTIKTIKEKDFDAKKHSKNLEDCKKPDSIIVCDLKTKEVITIAEDKFDAKKHSKDLKDCEAKCPLPGKEDLPAVSPECATPVELPKTGPADFLSAGVGFAAMGLAAHYYLASRRQ